MQHSHYRYSLWCALLLLLCCSGIAVAQAPIYKSVDENGNVVFSDEPPTPDAEPYDVPELSVIGTVKANPRRATAGRDNQSDSDSAIRRPDFSFVAPAADETFWGTAASLDVVFAVNPPMRQGMRIIVYIDNAQVSEMRSTRTTINAIDRGTHEIRAELIDQSGNVIAKAGPQQFFMKQFSQNFNGG